MKSPYALDTTSLILHPHISDGHLQQRTEMHPQESKARELFSVVVVVVLFESEIRKIIRQGK
jgi:hypothetical protein